MKRILDKKIVLVLVFFNLILLASCKKESYELIVASKEKNLEPNSVIANLMQRISMSDGSKDNILDKANCLTVILPIKVTVNGEELTITSEEDYKDLESIFSSSDSDNDILDIHFPIDIIANNFSRVMINSQMELSELAKNCNGENVEDDDIECVDFKYPVVANIFNISTELTNRITIANDEQLFAFIEGLDANLVVNIDLPINIILSSGTTSVVYDLLLLESLILENKDDCDEDDDFDFENDEDNDDDNDEQGTIPNTIQELTDVLTLCTWKVNEMEVNSQNLTNTYSLYNFKFNVDGTLTAENNGNTIEGTWEIKEVDSRLQLLTNIEILPDWNQEWQIHEIHIEDDGTQIEFESNENELRIKQNC